MRNRIILFFITLYIFTLSWTDTFSIGEWLPLHVIFTILISLMFFLQVIKAGRLSLKPIAKGDFFIIFFVIALIFTSAFNLNEKTFNYILAYILIFVFEYLVIKSAFYKNIGYEKLMRINVYAVVFLSMFVLFEFSLNYFFSINIQEFMSRHRIISAIYGGYLPRSYGLATEPGVVAFYYNTVGVLALWCIWEKMNIRRMLKIILSLLIIGGFLTTFSSAGIFFAIVSLIFVILWRGLSGIKKQIDLKRIVIINFLVIGLIIFGLLNYDVIKSVGDFFNPIFEKVSLNTEFNSVSDRLSRWERGITSIKNNPFIGTGLGSTTLSGFGSSTNWYMFLIVEAGIVGFLPIALFLIYVFIDIIKSKYSTKYYYLYGYIAGIMHFSVISTFYHPFLWTLIALFYIEKVSLVNSKKSKSMERT